VIYTHGPFLEQTLPKDLLEGRDEAPFRLEFKEKQEREEAKERAVGFVLEE